MTGHRLPRRAGILLHPTSLPGRHGIGDLGPAADAWIDFLVASGARVWQILPLGPTGYGNSPYAARSAFAGNPLLVSLDRLAADGLLPAKDLAAVGEAPAGPVDYDRVAATKLRALRTAAGRLSGTLASEFASFCAAEAGWLDDYALFTAVAAAHQNASWTQWDPPIARREPAAVAQWTRDRAADIHFEKFAQWTFYRQWRALHAKASAQGIAIMGDIPIFVAHDSADVWAARDQFSLDAAGEPAVVAGVPPDYFSKTGQRWGNPLYRWDVMAARSYDWWVARLQAMLAQVDIVRIDHFRGFASYWEVPAACPTAVEGRWVPGPGEQLFDVLRARLGDLPIVVEDLGFITPDVVALRDALGYPGMKVLQFAWDSGPTNPFLPFSFEHNCVVYTGTHDNDTTCGWYAQAPENERDTVRRYLAVSGEDIAWDLTRAALASVADTAIVPLQDLLSLGTESRMNFPGRPTGNWTWRYAPGDLQPAIAERFAELAALYGRATEA